MTFHLIMKKFLVTILALVYLTASTGAAVQVHYCMGSLVGWKLWNGSSTHKCSTCGMEKKQKDHCCKDEIKFVKNDNDQKTAESAFNFMRSLSATIETPFCELTSPKISSVTEKNPVSNASPRSLDKAIYIRNCAFLI